MSVACNLFARRKAHQPTSTLVPNRHSQIDDTHKNAPSIIKGRVSAFSSKKICVEPSQKPEMKLTLKSLPPKSILSSKSNLKAKTPDGEKSVHWNLSPEKGLVKARSMSDIINTPVSRLRNFQRGIAVPPDDNNNTPKEDTKKDKDLELLEKRLEAEEKARMAKLPMSEATCVCDRPKTNLLCRGCGFLSWGRVRRQCLLHCRVSYLLDIEKCPRCDRRTLVEVEKSAEKLN